MSTMKNPFLVGENIYFRPLEVDDVNDEYLQWLNNEEIAATIPSMCYPATMQSTRDYVAKAITDPGTVFFAIVEKSTGKHIGNIKLFNISSVHRTAEYGRLLGDPGVRGKGYGTEAVRLVLRYAFDVLNLRKVFASCLAHNAAAIRSNEKCGLSREGVLKEYRYHGGKYHDVLFMGVTRDEHAQARKAWEGKD